MIVAKNHIRKRLLGALIVVVIIVFIFLIDFLELLSPIGVAQSSPAAVVDRLIDIIMRLFALALSIILISRQPTIIGVILGVSILTLVLLGITTWLVRHANHILPRITRFLTRISSRSHFLKLSDDQLEPGVTNLLAGLRELQSTRKLLFTIFITLLMWCFFLFYYCLGFFALRLSLNAREAFSMVAIGMTFLPPSIPVMIGVFQGIMIAILYPFSYLDAVERTAYEILVFLVQFVVWSIFGIWGVMSTGMRFRDLLRVPNQTPEKPKIG